MNLSRVHQRITVVWCLAHVLHPGSKVSEWPKCHRVSSTYIDEVQPTLFQEGLCLWHTSKKLQLWERGKYKRILINEHKHPRISRGINFSPGFWYGTYFYFNAMRGEGQTCTFIFNYFHSLMLIWEVKYRKKLEYSEGNSLKLQPFWYTRSQNYRFAETFQDILKISILWQQIHIFVNKSVIF